MNRRNVLKTTLALVGASLRAPLDSARAQATTAPASAPPASAGTFPTHTPLFVGLLVGVILIVGGLTYFPALAVGPLVEHFAMNAGASF